MTTKQVSDNEIESRGLAAGHSRGLMERIQPACHG